MVPVLFIAIHSKEFVNLSRIDLGLKGEEIALREIKKRGYKVLERNYKTSLGEVDIIAKDGDVLVFIEVKTRRKSIVAAKEAVDRRKKKKLYQLALAYMKKRGFIGNKARFDVVAISMENGIKVELIRNAFEIS